MYIKISSVRMPGGGSMKVVVATPPPPPVGYYLGQVLFQKGSYLASILDAPLPGGMSVPGLNGYSFTHPNVGGGESPMTLGVSVAGEFGVLYLIESGGGTWFSAYNAEEINLSTPLTVSGGGGGGGGVCEVGDPYTVSYYGELDGFVGIFIGLNGNSVVLATPSQIISGGDARMTIGIVSAGEDVYIQLSAPFPDSPLMGSTVCVLTKL